MTFQGISWFGLVVWWVIAAGLWLYGSILAMVRAVVWVDWYGYMVLG